jgi:hypothetical protein
MRPTARQDLPSASGHLEHLTQTSRELIEAFDRILSSKPWWKGYPLDHRYDCRTPSCTRAARLRALRFWLSVT